METTKYTLLTPKERVRLVLNSAFANNVQRYVQACTKSREAPASDVENTEGEGSTSSMPSGVLSGVTSSVEGAQASSQWSPTDFYVSMLNFSLGFGTVLGFPRLCYKHGGGMVILGIQL
jgi:hypothetical protein